MRFQLLSVILIPALLAACASTPQPGSRVAQSGNLKVHPGLLGLPVPPELQQDGSGVATVMAGGAQGGPGGLTADKEGVRTQRSIYFDFDSSALKDEFAPALQAHARHLAANPNARVRIEGNADERGSADYNNRLGLKRAEVVRQALLGQGAPEKQVRIKSLGEYKPKLKGHDEESWAENRRADIVYEKDE